MFEFKVKAFKKQIVDSENLQLSDIYVFLSI